MAKRPNIHDSGIAFTPKVFAELVCPADKQVTRHTQRRVIAYWSGNRQAEWQVLVRCSVCRLEYVWHTNAIPEGLQLYHIRINAHGRLIPELNQRVESFTEEFTLLATSRQAAYRQSQFSHTMTLTGQLVETMVDGVEERDEHF